MKPKTSFLSVLSTFLVAVLPVSAGEDPLCGTTEPIACSVYAAAGNIRDPARKFYSDKFHAPCAMHDYCYRYGYATYRRSKADCDNRFLADMLETCNNIDWRTFVTPGYNFTECRTVANIFYGAVSTLDAAKQAYQRGTATCEYEGFCPPGKFETTGRLKGCKCPAGSKVYTGIAKETAYCKGSVDCPPGRFSTTGQYRGCDCPPGSPKRYLDPASAYARCADLRRQCPGGTFGTTGSNYDCSCPQGSRKEYLDIASARATCTKECPSGQFATTGTYRGCSCPDGKRKDYLDVFKYKAKCR